MSHPERPGDQLLFLSDVIPLQPMRTVVSFGDVLVALGLGCVTATAMWARRPRRIGNPRHLRRADADSLKPERPGVLTSSNRMNQAREVNRSLPGESKVARVGKVLRGMFYRGPVTVPAGFESTGAESAGFESAGVGSGGVESAGVGSGGVESGGSVPTASFSELASKFRAASGGVVLRLREARAAGVGLTPKELASQVASQIAAQRDETTFKNWVEADGPMHDPPIEVPIVAGLDIAPDTEAPTHSSSGPAPFAPNGHRSSFARPVGTLDGNTADLSVDSLPDPSTPDASTPDASVSDPRMAARLRLLQVTGDVSALRDLNHGAAADFEDMAAEHVVGVALRRHALDDRLVARAARLDVHDSRHDAPDHESSPLGPASDPASRSGPIQ